MGAGGRKYLQKELANYGKLVYDCSGETWFLFFQNSLCSAVKIKTSQSGSYLIFTVLLSDEKVFVEFWHIHAKTPCGTVTAE